MSNMTNNVDDVLNELKFSEKEKIAFKSGLKKIKGAQIDEQIDPVAEVLSIIKELTENEI